jgi:hypothetical protein
VPPRRRLQVRASTAARASAKVCACLRPGPEGWRRSRQRAPLRAAPSRAEVLIAARDDRLGRALGDAQLAEDLGGERVGNGEHAEQDALVPERLPVGVGRARGGAPASCVGNAEAAAAGVLERARPELLLKALAHRLEVDPQRRQRVRVDPGQAGGDTRPERLLDGIRADAELPQDRRGAPVPVADQHQQQVLRADVVVPEPAGLTLRSSW